MTKISYVKRRIDTLKWSIKDLNLDEVQSGWWYGTLSNSIDETQNVRCHFKSPNRVAAWAQLQSMIKKLNERALNGGVRVINRKKSNNFNHHEPE